MLNCDSLFIYQRISILAGIHKEEMKESCFCCGQLQGGNEEKLSFLWRVFDTMKRAEV